MTICNFTTYNFAHFVSNCQNQQIGRMKARASEAKKYPLPLQEEGTHTWRRLWMQRKTKNQVGFSGARVGGHLSEDRY